MKYVAWIDVIACVVIAISAVGLRPHTGWWVAGLAILLVAFPLWMLARVQLGDAFSVRADPRRLVTTGLYARIRHPIYLFGTAAFFGAFLALQVWWLFLLWLALTPIEVVRLRREDRRLHEKFGAGYDRYRATTWM
jgi:protein-S-isoprenylcysteine O-methyltransferase Ste14